MTKITIEINQDDRGVWVADCFPYDVVTQGRTIHELLSRLDACFQIEIEHAGGLENIPKRGESS